MKFTEKLIKQIDETAYLTAENATRYRPIMRFFYERHEQAENWLYKEDIYQVISSYIPDYTIEECQRDLDFLVSKMSLTTVQDTENANTLDKFKYKNYRYQMTDYAIEIERMTIHLEELEVKISSLEPRLFERIKLKLKKLINIENLTEADLYELWSDLTTDFDNLNYSYQDFLKKFQEPKTEELLQSVAFIEYKNQLIHYLNDFIKEYLVHSKEIKNIFVQIPDKNIHTFMDALIAYQKKAPKLRPDFDYEYLRTVNEGKWRSLKKWFIGNHSMSEGDRLLQATNQIISKITKYAANLVELHGNMINRKEEYKYLCHLFDEQIELKDAHKLASAILGVNTVRHFKGISELNSDTIVSSWSVPSIMIPLEPIRRGIRIKSEKTPIQDKTKEKEILLQRYQEEEQKQRQILRRFLSKSQKSFIGRIELSKEERRYLFTLMEKAKKKQNQLQGTDPVFGYPYKIEFLPQRCQIESTDGIFEMDSIHITFGGDDRG